MVDNRERKTERRWGRRKDCKPIYLRIAPESKGKLKVLAERLELSFSELVETIIDLIWGLENHESRKQVSEGEEALSAADADNLSAQTLDKERIQGGD